MYSKIVSIEVYNFMVYSHAKIYFDERNILNLKGYNSSGKSTMLKALAVCLTNMYARNQAKFIRHGEKYFRIDVCFDDGVMIRRDKYIEGQSLYEIYKDDECIFTTKEGGRLTKIDGVPKPIQDYLGLCNVSTGCLNYQVRQDALWLIETTGSENYNSLNEILKTEEISKANALINSDKNKLGSDITKLEGALQETQYALIDAQKYSDDLLQRLENKEQLLSEFKDRYIRTNTLKDNITECSGIRLIPEVGRIDSKKYETVLDIENNLKSISEFKQIPSVGTVKTKQFEKIAELASTFKAIFEFEKIAPEVSVLNYEKVVKLANIVSTMSGLVENLKESKLLNDELNTVHKSLETIVNRAKEKGIRFVKCDNCGTYMEVK